MVSYSPTPPPNTHPALPDVHDPFSVRCSLCRRSGRGWGGGAYKALGGTATAFVPHTCMGQDVRAVGEWSVRSWRVVRARVG